MHQLLVDVGHLEQVLPELRMLFLLPPCAVPARMPPDPVLDPEHQMLQAVVELLGFLVGVDGAVMADLRKNASPPEREADRHVLTEVLDRANAGMELVSSVVSCEMRVIEVGVPGRLAIGKEMGHVSAGKGAHRINDTSDACPAERGSFLRMPALRRTRRCGWLLFGTKSLKRASVIVKPDPLVTVTTFRAILAGGRMNP